MPQTGHCTDVTCEQDLTELYECHCCNWLICLKHLLEHVEVSSREKKAQLSSLRNDLTSISYTLEQIVEKKLQEIEHEKQLIDQAKTIINKSTCTVEEIQSIYEEIHQAIVSNRKEETVVKVEPALIDLSSRLCSNEISNETNRNTSETLNTYPSSRSSSNNVLQQPTFSPSRILRRRTNEFEKSTTSKNNDHSLKVDNCVHINAVSDDSMDSLKDEVDGDDHDQESIGSVKIRHNRCPLTFDGAFGLTEANHLVEICPTGNSFPRNFIGHLTQKHRLKKAYAQRLFEAIKRGDNPHTTKLFTENEDVIDRIRNIPCPFSVDMIASYGHCPPQTRKIPCSFKLIPYFLLARHLTGYHEFPNHMAQKISKKHRQKLIKMKIINENHVYSH